MLEVLFCKLGHSLPSLMTGIKLRTSSGGSDHCCTNCASNVALLEFSLQDEASVI